MAWEYATIGGPPKKLDYIEKLQRGLMEYTWKRVLFCLILPVLVFAYEFVLDQSTVVVEAKVLEIHEPVAPTDLRQHRDMRHLVDFEVTGLNGQKEKASTRVEDDEVRTGQVALGKPLSLLYNPNFAGESYRSNQPFLRWIFTVIAGVICGTLFILAAFASLARWLLR